MHLQPGPAAPEARPDIVTDTVQQQRAAVASDPAASGVSDAELLDALGRDVQIYTCDHGADGSVTVADGSVSVAFTCSRSPTNRAPLPPPNLPLRARSLSAVTVL